MTIDLDGHRRRMSRFRRSRRKSGICRQCKKLAKINQKTGEPMSACDEHLAADKKRKQKAKP